MASEASPSPISDESLRALAERVRAAWRLVSKRAPESVRARVEAGLAEVVTVLGAGLGGGADAAPARIDLARRLEALDAELHGREAFVPQLYRDGRLGVLRVQDPIRIRESVDMRRVHAHVERYEARIRRAEARLHWFYVRAGMQVEPPRKRPPWEMPYASFEEAREFLWGRVSRHSTPPTR